MLTGCMRENASYSDKMLNEISEMCNTDVDSAYVLIKKIDIDALSDEMFTKYCLLAGEITSKTYNPVIPSFLYEKAYDWLSLNEPNTEMIQLLLYWGRAYAYEGEYNKAMSTYTKDLDLAVSFGLDYWIGLIYSYMGDLYENSMMLEKALEKYQKAAVYFDKSNKFDSYVCALRDCGRSCARLDSLQEAWKILNKADSLALLSNNPNVKSSVANTFAGVCVMIKKYDLAEKKYNEALELGRNKLPNYMGLIDLYVNNDSLSKAKLVLEEMSTVSKEYKSTISASWYSIYRKENKYEDALNALENYVLLNDSIQECENKEKIVEIEEKYNTLKNRQIINQLKLEHQYYIILSLISISLLLIVILGYIVLRKKAREKEYEQKMELERIKVNILSLKTDLRMKDEILSDLSEKENEYCNKRNEIVELKKQLSKLQRYMIMELFIFKELFQLANKNIPGNNRPLMTEIQWKQVVVEVTKVYPTLYNYVYGLNSELSEPEWRYCCFCMLGFDSNLEARLLNINTASVRMKRLRLRQKLGITLDSHMTLCDFLSENCIA